MSLFKRASFEALVLSLGSTEIVHQWGDTAVGKVGGKIFALHTRDPRIAFKCSDLSFRLLPDLAGVRPARYLARAKWVEAAPGCALSPDELSAYIEQAHRIVAARLPAKVRADLGLEIGLENAQDAALGRDLGQV